MSAQFINEVLELVNEERSNVGLAPLESDSQLETIAEDHSESMAVNDFVGHQDPTDGSGPGDRIDEAGYEWSTWGENVAWGYSTPEEVIDGWMNSSGHRANILNPDFTEIGIGYEFLENDTGSVNYNHYWTQVFGTPLEGSDTSVGNAPVNDPLIDDIPVDDPPADDAPLNDIPVDDAPVNDSPVDDPVNNLNLEDDLTGLINQERTEAGLDPLRIDEQLLEAAQDHSRNMALNDFVSHDGLDGSSPGERIEDAGYEWSVWGENIVVNSDDPDAIMDYFTTGSGTNRDNILDPDFQDIGIGYEFLENDTGLENHNHYITINFGGSEI